MIFLILYDNINIRGDILSTFYDFYLIKKNKETNLFEYKGKYLKNEENNFNISSLYSISSSFIPDEISHLIEQNDVSIFDDELKKLISYDEEISKYITSNYLLLSYNDVCNYANKNLIKHAYMETDTYKALKFTSTNIDIFPILNEYYDSVITPEEYFEKTLRFANNKKDISHIPISWIEPTSIEYLCLQLMNNLNGIYLDNDDDFYILITIN